MQQEMDHQILNDNAQKQTEVSDVQQRSIPKADIQNHEPIQSINTIDSESSIPLDSQTIYTKNNELSTSTNPENNEQAISTNIPDNKQVFLENTQTSSVNIQNNESHFTLNTQESKQELQNINVLEKNERTFLEEIPEEIDKEVFLKKQNYIIKNKIIIHPSGILNLSPGTKLEFRESGIVCYGHILAKGTAEEPIEFTSKEGWDNIIIYGSKAKGVFHYCHISKGLGIPVFLDDNKYILFKGNKIAGGAILFAESCTGEIQHCKISQNGENAIEILSAKEVIVSSSEIIKNKGNGIVCENSTIKIISNKICENSLSGFLALEKSEGVLLQNDFVANKNAGIFIQNYSKFDILENNFFYNKLGIFLIGLSTSLIENNSVQQNMYYGIFCCNNSESKIHKNVILGNLISGIALEQRARSTITSNKIQKNKYAGITILNDVIVHISDNIISDSEYVLYREQTAKTVLDNNTVINCQENEGIGIPSFLVKENLGQKK